jgi:hypothetical protein
MKLHRNARTCPLCRSLIVGRVTDSGQNPTAVALEFRVTERTVRKWLKRPGRYLSLFRRTKQNLPDNTAKSRTDHLGKGASAEHVSGDEQLQRSQIQVSQAYEDLTRGSSLVQIH